MDLREDKQVTMDLKQRKNRELRPETQKINKGLHLRPGRNCGCDEEKEIPAPVGNRNRIVQPVA
jgi:hypothetical protein